MAAAKAVVARRAQRARGRGGRRARHDSREEARAAACCQGGCARRPSSGEAGQCTDLIEVQEVEHIVGQPNLRHELVAPCEAAAKARVRVVMAVMARRLGRSGGGNAPLGRQWRRPARAIVSNPSVPPHSPERGKGHSPMLPIEKVLVRDAAPASEKSITGAWRKLRTLRCWGDVVPTPAVTRGRGDALFRSPLV